MKILRREPVCADLKVEEPVRLDNKPNLSNESCKRILDDIRTKAKSAILGITHSKLRQAKEAKDRKNSPEYLDADVMHITSDRIELEKTELSIIFEQLETFWESVPEELKPTYQEEVDKLRQNLQQQIG